MNKPFGQMKRAKGIKAVQSQQNFADLKAEDLSQVISQQTVCYCGSYEIKLDDWFDNYKYIQTFKSNIKTKLGKSHSQVTFSVMVSKPLLVSRVSGYFIKSFRWIIIPMNQCKLTQRIQGLFSICVVKNIPQRMHISEVCLSATLEKGSLRLLM